MGEWVSSMEDSGLSASRVRQAFNVLAAMLDAAISNGMLVRNAARGVELPRIPKSQRRFLTEEQVMRLADTGPPEYRSLILVLAYWGMRWHYAGRCDLLRPRLQVMESAVEVDGHLSWGLPKTHRQRSVSIPSFVCEALAAPSIRHPSTSTATTPGLHPRRVRAHRTLDRHVRRTASTVITCPKKAPPTFVIASATTTAPSARSSAPENSSTTTRQQLEDLLNGRCDLPSTCIGDRTAPPERGCPEVSAGFTRCCSRS